MTTAAPYGSWRSPITADLLVEDVVSFAQLAVSGSTVFCNESRPSEAGREVVVRRDAEGSPVDALPEDMSARTLVHEYGGASFAVWGDELFVVNLADQRIWRLGTDGTHGTDGTAHPLTPEPPAPMAYRFADFQVVPGGGWLVAVRERHLEREVVNDLVAVPTREQAEPRLVVEGHDFFAAPRVSPDGSRLAWLSWDHPNMPWDGTQLWEALLSPSMEVGSARLVAGGRSESVSQPRWSPDGVLHFVSDRSGWWNLYADDGSLGRPLAPREAEFSWPDWVLGQSSYGFLEDGRVVVAWCEASGCTRLGVVGSGGAGGRTGTAGLEVIEQPYTALSNIVPMGDAVLAVAGSPERPPAVVRIEVPGGGVEVLKESRPMPVDAAYISVPRAVEFPTENGLTAHAFYYPPRNPEFRGPPGERPPLLVMCHGGPTAAASSVLNLRIQYWTSRGFSVVDVDYGGSSGYGRAYRERLDGNWGVVDVDDCTNAALWLAEQGEVDARRMVMRGSSAGGYTTLCALAFKDVFAAGASHYGVADLEALAIETHKFECRYLDRLVGPYPEARNVYVQRSPVHNADRLNCPVILFQGAEDKVVPPQQSEVLAAALRRKGLTFAYLVFEGEQHGFRQAETVKRAAAAELSFYGQVLGFEPADDIEPVPIENAEALARHRAQCPPRYS